MSERKQEKIGWVGGWGGGFVWVLVLSVILLVRGKTLPALIGLVITAAAYAAVLRRSPWRHPRTTYRRLMAPIYVLFLSAMVWGVWALGDPRQMGINSWWSLLLLLPVMMPLWSIGDRRWGESDAQQQHAADGASRRR